MLAAKIKTWLTIQMEEDLSLPKATGTNNETQWKIGTAQQWKHILVTARRVTDLTDLEGCLIQRAALEINILPPLWSRMLTSVSPFFLISLLMVSVYLSCVLHLGIISFTSMSSILLVIIILYGYHLYA